MTTLRLPPRLEEMTAEERAVLERLAKRRGVTLEQVASGSIYGVQSHWPALIEANMDVNSASFMQIGALPQLTKEAMHVAVSMSNACDF